MIADLDLNLLKVFDALLEDGSVTAAAETLHLSVPATSRALGRLRRAMNDPILVRAGRGLAPTPFALRAAPQVRSVLEAASSLMTSDRELDVAAMERTFTLRINDGIAATLGIDLVRATSLEAPGVTLRFVPEADEGIDALRDGTIDVDLGVRTGSEPDLRSALLYIEHLVGIVRADSPLGLRRRPTLRQLCGHPHVSASRRGRSRGPLDEVLRANGLTRTVAAVVPSFAVAALLASTSDLVGLVPARLAQEYGGPLSLRSFPIPVALPAVEISMVWHARLDTDPAQRWLRSTIERVSQGPPDAIA